MSKAKEQFEGGCLCGAVRFIATGEPKGIYWCHCQSCRKHTGAPVAVFVAYEPQAYKLTKGEIAKFDSTPRQTRRGFCARCGSTLTCESLPEMTPTHFHVGAFDLLFLRPSKTRVSKLFDPISFPQTPDKTARY